MAAPHGGRGRHWIAAAVVGLALPLAAALFFHDATARLAIGTVARAAGYDVALGTLHVGAEAAHARDVRVRNRAGEPVFDADRVDLDYSVRDLLPGGRRRFGLKAIDVARPRLTLIHHADGTYNVSLPKASNAPARPNTTPVDMRIRIRDGSVAIVDRFVAAPRERRSSIEGVRVDALFSPVERSHYEVDAAYVENAHRFPLRGRANFDEPRGYEIQHWSIARLPVAALTDFVLPNRAVVVDAGNLEQFDLRVAGLAGRDDILHYHLFGRGRLTEGRLTIAALTKPIRDARGRFDLYDDGVTVPGLDGSVNGVPLHLVGGLYHFDDPQVRFALTSRGDLARYKQIATTIADRPFHGALGLEGFVEGSASQPVVFAHFESPALALGAYTFENAHGTIALSGTAVDIFATGMRYGPIGIFARGTLVLERHVGAEVMARVAAPASRLPYASAIVPGMQLGGTAVLRGIDDKLDTRGYLVGASVRGDRLDAPFAVGANGVGTIGPFAVERRDGASIYGRVALDRQANEQTALLDIRNLAIASAPQQTLPGFAPPALPPRLDGTIDAHLGAVVRGSTVAALGGNVRGRGSWGEIDAVAGASASGYGATGRYRGSFERLAALTGNAGARGAIDAPFAAASDGSRTVVQVHGARFRDARIRGVPLGGAETTFALRPHAIDVIAASARIADRDVTAQGSFGNGGRVRITAAGLDLSALRDAGVPLQRGRLSAVAYVGGTFAHPTALANLAVTGGRYANAALGGDARLRYDGDLLHVDDATLAYAGAYATARGRVAGLGGTPRYDVAASIRGADIATLARSVPSPLRYPEGSIDADVHVGGAGARPAIEGSVRAEGSINGLAFHGARATLRGTGATIAAREGRLSVGSTTLAFGGDVSAARQTYALRADRADLADFNGYFDEADVLGGRGRIALTLDGSPKALRTSGEVAVHALRYRHFRFGDASASWRTRGSAIAATARVIGPNGRAAVDGTVALAGTRPLRDLAARSSVDLRTRIVGLQLGTWLPAANVSVPVVGTLDGDITVRGRYPALELAANAAVTNGVAGRVPIRRLTFAATAANGRGRITEATLVTSALTADAGGTFGLRPSDPFDVSARALSPDINALAVLATGKSAGVSGAFEGRFHVTGTASHPQLASTLDLSDVRYESVNVPRIHAVVQATPARVDVRDGLVQLARGSIAFAGRMPLGGGGRTPVAVDLTPRAVDLAPYSTLVPDGSQLRGVLDGDVALRGTLAAPRLAGRLSLANGSYRSNHLRGPITGIVLDLAFEGTQARIRRLHGHLAPGNIDGSGTVGVGDLRNPAHALAMDVRLRADRALAILPQYYDGFIDGTLTARATPGGRPTIGGDLTFSGARVPYGALIPKGGSTAPASAPLDIGFDLGLRVGKDVRIAQGPVDIGAAGAVRLGGTLAHPTLDGAFDSTDGTLAFYRSFTLQSGRVAFSSDDGIIPTVDATATTHVPDPSTEVLLHVSGPATALNLTFASEPNHSREQIVGLLVNAQALGAVSGVPQTAGSGASGPSPIAGVTQGYINQQFTRTFLEPLEGSLGTALGLQDLQISYGFGGELSAVARRVIGKKLAIQYGQTLGGAGGIGRQSLGVSLGGDAAAAQMTFYSSPGQTSAFGGSALTPYLQSGFLQQGPTNYTLQSIEPPAGSGFVFTYQRRFP